MAERPKSTYVMKMDLALAEKLRAGLLEQGFELAQPAYTEFQAKKKGVSCTLYTSGKLVVQGKDKGDFIQFYLEPEILKTFSYGYEEELSTSPDPTPRIGIDESGKGDFFGPLTIAGVYAGNDMIGKLQDIGIRDSKTLSDTKILKYAKAIRALVPYAVVRIGPRKYNELYKKFGNLNKLLAWGHATAIEELMAKTKCNNVLVDKFAEEYVVEMALKRKGLNPQLHQRHKAEDDPVVAAASILARAAFVEGLAILGKEVGSNLPKGANPRVIGVGRALVAKHGLEILETVGKVHFKTYRDITNFLQ